MLNFAVSLPLVNTCLLCCTIFICQISKLLCLLYEVRRLRPSHRDIIGLQRHQVHLKDQKMSIRGGGALCSLSSGRLASIGTESSVIPIHVNSRTWVEQKVFGANGMLNSSSNRARSW